MGEDSIAYEYDADGNLTGSSTAGSWRAGVNGGQPGFVMPVDHSIGFNYYQELAPADGAVDQATISANGLAVGRYTNVLRILETTTIDPNDLAFKYYAPGTGEIRTDDGLNADLKNPTDVFGLVPEPSSWALMIVGFGLVGTAMRQRARPGPARLRS